MPRRVFASARQARARLAFPRCRSWSGASTLVRQSRATDTFRLRFHCLPRLWHLLLRTPPCKQPQRLTRKVACHDSRTRRRTRASFSVPLAENRLAAGSLSSDLLIQQRAFHHPTVFIHAGHTQSAIANSSGPSCLLLLLSWSLAAARVSTRRKNPSNLPA